jgi:hypothetical protein
LDHQLTLPATAANHSSSWLSFPALMLALRLLAAAVPAPAASASSSSSCSAKLPLLLLSGGGWGACGRCCCCCCWAAAAPPLLEERSLKATDAAPLWLPSWRACTASCCHTLCILCARMA